MIVFDLYHCIFARMIGSMINLLAVSICVFCKQCDNSNIYVQHARCKCTNASESTVRMLGKHNINGDFLKYLHDSFRNDKQVSIEHQNWSDIVTSTPLHSMVICKLLLTYLQSLPSTDFSSIEGIVDSVYPLSPLPPRASFPRGRSTCRQGRRKQPEK